VLTEQKLGHGRKGSSDNWGRCSLGAWCELAQAARGRLCLRAMLVAAGRATIDHSWTCTCKRYSLFMHWPASTPSTRCC